MCNLVEKLSTVIGSRLLRDVGGASTSVNGSRLLRDVGGASTSVNLYLLHPSTQP
jgi:hypothetical protein